MSDKQKEFIKGTLAGWMNLLLTGVIGFLLTQWFGRVEKHIEAGVSREIRLATAERDIRQHEKLLDEFKRSYADLLLELRKLNQAIK
jgi:hypothetical protein